MLCWLGICNARSSSLKPQDDDSYSSVDLGFAAALVSCSRLLSPSRFDVTGEDHWARVALLPSSGHCQNGLSCERCDDHAHLFKCWWLKKKEEFLKQYNLTFATTKMLYKLKIDVELFFLDIVVYSIRYSTCNNADTHISCFVLRTGSCIKIKRKTEVFLLSEIIKHAQ